MFVCLLSVCLSTCLRPCRNLDDCWLTKDRDANGDLVVDKRAFPDGLEPVIKHVHSKGLKFGLYLSAGNHTCQGRAGSRGYEDQDAALLARLEVDYLKYDDCDIGLPATWSDPKGPMGETGIDSD